MADKFIKTEQIGQVTLKHIKLDQVDGPVYSDGPIEGELYQEFKRNPDSGSGSENAKYSSWAREYHLTPVRHNLLKWFPFNHDANVLEVGAGCGALTGLLCNRLKKVVALEYSHQRALVTAQRHSKCSNLEVIVGGLQDYEVEEKFDYVLVIGVLEYARTFYYGETPYESFLSKVRSLMKPSGTLILAIENKIGFKYITGAPEDHTGRVFDSIYGYPYPSKVQTFSKRELTELLHSAGFHNLKWYYPFPDYKMPQEVMSEEITPGELDSVWSLFPAQTGGTSRRMEILSERRLGKTIANAGLFGEFANSFLVVAHKEDMHEKFRCFRFMGANQRRKPEYRTNIRMCVNGRDKIVIKSADSNKSVGFIQEIAERETLAQKFFDKKAKVVTGRLNGSSLHYPYIKFPSVEDLVADALERGDLDFGKSIIEQYIQFLHSLPSRTCIPQQFMHEFEIPSREIIRAVKCFDCAIIDCIPRNIKVGPQSWYIIDSEWTSDYPLPIDYVVFRALATLVIDLQAYIQIKASKNMPVVLYWGHGINRQYIPLSWFEILEAMTIPLKRMVRWETHLQNKICLGKPNLRIRLKKKPRVLTSVRIEEIRTNCGRPGWVHLTLKKVVRRFLRLFKGC